MRRNACFACYKGLIKGFHDIPVWYEVPEKHIRFITKILPVFGMYGSDIRYQWILAPQLVG